MYQAYSQVTESILSGGLQITATARLPPAFLFSHRLRRRQLPPGGSVLVETCDISALDSHLLGYSGQIQKSPFAKVVFTLTSGRTASFWVSSRMALSLPSRVTVIRYSPAWR